MKCLVSSTQPLKGSVQSRRGSLESISEQMYSTTARMQLTTVSPKAAKQPSLPLDTGSPRLRDVPVQSSVHTQVWQRVRAKLKSRLALQYLEREINLFGVNTLPQHDGDATPAAELVLKKVKLAHDIEERVVQRTGYVLLPGSYLKGCWGVVYLTLMLYTVALTPYSMAFWEEDTDWITVEFVVDGLFFVDILITFNSAYYSREGQLVTDRKRIVMKYLKTWFVLDFCACFPLYLFQDDNSQLSEDGNKQYNALLRLARLPRFYRLFRITRVYKMMRQFRSHRVLERLHEKFCGKGRVVQMASFCVLVSICIHLMACFWFIVARAEGLTPECWVLRSNLQESSASNLYISSLLWALSTLATVGYGDIAPGTTLERLAASLWMLFGMSILTFIISSIAIYLHQTDVREVTLTSKLAIITEFAAENNLDRSILLRLKDAIRYNVLTSSYTLLEKRDLFQELPRQLKYEVAVSMHNNAIRTLPFFTHRDHVFISSVVPFLHNTFVAAKDFVYREKEYAEEVYFIVDGRCLMICNEVHVIKKLQQGSYFGEIEVIEQVPRLFSISAATDCSLLTMKKRLLMVIKYDFPKVYEEMKEVAAIRKELNEKSKRQFLRLLHLAKLETFTHESDMEHFLHEKLFQQKPAPLRMVQAKNMKMRLLQYNLQALAKRVDALEPSVLSTQNLLVEILAVVKEMKGECD